MNTLIDYISWLKGMLMNHQTEECTFFNFLVKVITIIVIVEQQRNNKTKLFSRVSFIPSVL